MTLEEIRKVLREKFPQKEFTGSEKTADALYIDAENLLDVARFLKDDSRLLFDSFLFVTATDFLSHLELVYFLFSYTNRHRIALKVKLPRQDPQIESLASLWPAASWHERETYDLFGIIFLNHPDLSRILTPEGWEGYPLRKDFVHENLIRRPD